MHIGNEIYGVGNEICQDNTGSEPVWGEIILDTVIERIEEYQAELEDYNANMIREFNKDIMEDLEKSAKRVLTRRPIKKSLKISKKVLYAINTRFVEKISKKLEEMRNEVEEKLCSLDDENINKSIFNEIQILVSSI